MPVLAVGLAKLTKSSIRGAADHLDRRGDGHGELRNPHRPASVITGLNCEVCCEERLHHHLSFTCNDLLRLAWTVDCSARPTRAAASTHSRPGTRNKPHSVYHHAGLRSTASRGGRYDGVMQKLDLSGHGRRTGETSSGERAPCLPARGQRSRVAASPCICTASPS